MSADRNSKPMYDRIRALGEMSSIARTASRTQESILHPSDFGKLMYLIFARVAPERRRRRQTRVIGLELKFKK